MKTNYLFALEFLDSNIFYMINIFNVQKPKCDIKKSDIVQLFFV